MDSKRCKMSKIIIPELKRFGYSSMNTLKAFLLLYGYEVGRLKLKYPTNDINNPPEYKTFIIDKLMHVVSTYIMVVEECHDYATACTIVRTLIDSVSAYHLIYHSETNDEMLLRHYLYILDGTSQKLEILKRRSLHITEKITPQEYQELSDQLSFTKNNIMRDQDVCVRNIKSLSIYKSHQQAIDTFIKDCNWKYINIEEINHKNAYSWTQIQALFPTEQKKLYSDLCAYLSHFVHGLSMSNLVFDTEDKDLYEPLSANVAIVLNFMHESMINDFDVDRNFLINGFLKSPNFKAYCSYLTD